MQIDRSRRPLSSPEVKFNIPQIQNFILDNGLNIFFSKKNDLPIIRVTLLVNNGSKYDPSDLKGLSNLLTMCLDEGAGNYNALQLADEFETLGAQFSVSCNEDVNIISLQVLKDNFLPALKLVNDVLTQPHFKEEDFNREKNKVLVRLNQSKAEPDYIADIAFEYFLFGKISPYAFPVAGIERTVVNLKPDLIRSVYQENFTPSNSSMIIVGDIDKEVLHQDLATIFGKWDGKSFSKNLLVNRKKNKNKIYLIDKPDAVQTEIRVGHLSSKRSDEDYFQKQIINLILGGQFSSRLNLNLREKNGYTYGINSYYNYLMEAGYFAVSTSIDADNTAKALEEIFIEIKKIKDGITIDELTFAKSSMTKKYPSNFETYRQIAANISTKVIHNLPDDYFETYVEKINSLSLDEVNNVARNSVFPDELISVLVGDSRKIMSQLEEDKFGQISVLELEDIF